MKNMKKQILIMVLFLCSTAFYAQSARISIGPKTFQKEVACKMNLPQKTDIVIRVFDGKKEIKHFNYNQVKATAVKINLNDLQAGKTYIMSVFDKQNQLLYTREIIKSKK